MANHKSALKRVKQSANRRLRNKATLSQMRTAIKKFRTIIDDKDPLKARAGLSGVYSIIDRTGKKGTIHRNTAARYKARLAQALERSKGG